MKCECGYSNAKPVYPVYCRCGRIHQAAETGDELQAGQPGTELARLIAGDVTLGPFRLDLTRLGYSPTNSCSCETRIYKMNKWGPEGCAEHKETIVGWLQTSAAAVGLVRLPKFIFSGLVDLAIKNARDRARQARQS